MAAELGRLAREAKLGLGSGREDQLRTKNYLLSLAAGMPDSEIALPCAEARFGTSPKPTSPVK